MTNPHKEMEMNISGIIALSTLSSGSVFAGPSSRYFEYYNRRNVWSTTTLNINIISSECKTCIFSLSSYSKIDKEL
jgi:hypothetical protein